MRDFIVVSYYTRNTEYEQAAMRLKESLDILHVPYRIQPINNLGTWDRNTHYKAQFIKKMIETVPVDQDIVFLDADAVVHKYPWLFHEIEEDLAAYYYQARQLASGTLYFKNNERSRVLLSEWVKKNEANPSVLDQATLQDSMEHSHLLGAVSFKSLPAEYCKIYDLMADIKDPVIEHFQLSRRARAEVSIYAQEKQKYSELWRKDYQPSRCALPLVKYITQNTEPGWNLLDIGCGNGLTVRKLRAYGYDCWGSDITLSGLKTDISPKEFYFIEAPIWNMPFVDNQFNFTFSTDVLEHIPPAMVRRSIAEIFRITKIKTFHCIANFPDIRNGQDLHLSKHSIDQWNEWFMAVNNKKIGCELIDRKEFLQLPEYQIKGGEVI